MNAIKGGGDTQTLLGVNKIELLALWDAKSLAASPHVQMLLSSTRVQLPKSIHFGH